MTTPTSKMGYFALPLELRNQIMDLVLEPGHIHLPTPDAADRQSYPGFQLLATSSQAYSEGHVQFYSNNIFHLPPGPLCHTKQILKHYQPKHLDLIRRVTVRCSLCDLFCADSLQRLHRAISPRADIIPRNEIKRHILLPSQNEDMSHNSRYYTMPPHKTPLTDPDWDLVNDIIRKAWKSKIIFARDTFPNLEELRVVFSDLAGIPTEFNISDALNLSNTEDTSPKNREYTVDGAVNFVLEGNELHALQRTRLVENGPLRRRYQRKLMFGLYHAVMSATRDIRIRFMGNDGWEGVKELLKGKARSGSNLKVYTTGL